MDNSQHIPHGYCQCGCGRETKPARRTDPRVGAIQGKPQRFVAGHQHHTPERRMRIAAELAAYREEWEHLGIDYGRCQCGCGKETAIATRYLPSGWFKGEPKRYISGHGSAPHLTSQRASAIDKLRGEWERAGVPYGLCLCGCGEETPRAAKTQARRGYVKGEPMRYLIGHQQRKSERWREEDRGYDSPCWVWQLTIAPNGYGLASVRLAKGKFRNTSAHRAVWLEMRGTIPSGLQLDHLCRQRDCVNPDHLEPVTAKENQRRAREARATSP